jgi:hypothetical protein
VNRATAKRRRAPDPPEAPAGERTMTDMLLRGLGLLLVVGFAAFLLSMNSLG